MKRNKDVSIKKSRSIELILKQILKYREQLDLEIHPSSMDGNKIPLITSWAEKSSSNPRQINSWASDFKTTSFGVALSKCKENYVVLDIDVKDGIDGNESLTEIPGYSGKELFSTFVVRTPSGGKHFWFKSNRNLKGKISLCKGIDILGVNQRVIAPGSQQADGSSYDVIKNNTIKFFPQWLEKVLEDSRRGKNNVAVCSTSNANRHTGDLENYLSRIDPNIGYEDWMKVGFASINVCMSSNQIGQMVS